MESFGRRFGCLIREKRGIEGWSQDGLAAKSDLTKARISDIETGKITNPQARTIDALCVALNISREERDACRVTSGPRLPPRLLENLALRFGLNNPAASEDELADFLKEKALEFWQLTERLDQISASEERIAIFTTAANAALEEGDFQLADERLVEAEDVQLESTTVPVLEKQYSLRYERGRACLLSGEIETATEHWELAANYFHYIDLEMEAEKRYEHCTRLREYGYRYRNAKALFTATGMLELNLSLWRPENNLQNWCRAMNALGAINFRLSQFDTGENFLIHVSQAKSTHEAVREKCSEIIQPYYYAASNTNLANVYSMREFAQSDDEYSSNLAKGTQLLIDNITLVPKEEKPESWGILQHNIGHFYTLLFVEQNDKRSSMDLINKAVHHLELSFEVRDPADENTLQYWIASCRSLGEALIERSAYQPTTQVNDDLDRAFAILTEALAKISEGQHPHQWAEIQAQLRNHSEQKLRLTTQ